MKVTTTITFNNPLHLWERVVRPDIGAVIHEHRTAARVSVRKASHAMGISANRLRAVELGVATLPNTCFAPLSRMMHEWVNRPMEDESLQNLVDTTLGLERASIYKRVGCALKRVLGC